MFLFIFHFLRSSSAPTEILDECLTVSLWSFISIFSSPHTNDQREGFFNFVYEQVSLVILIDMRLSDWPELLGKARTKDSVQSSPDSWLSLNKMKSLFN